MWSLLGWKEKHRKLCVGGIHTHMPLFCFQRRFLNTVKESNIKSQACNSIKLKVDLRIGSRCFGCHTNYVLVHLMSPSCQKLGRAAGHITPDNAIRCLLFDFQLKQIWSHSQYVDIFFSVMSNNVIGPIQMILCTAFTSSLVMPRIAINTEKVPSCHPVADISSAGS